jgi:hypothetical protein
MHRLAQSRQKNGPSPSTILGTFPNDLAIPERERLFAGLEALVNVGDDPGDYQDFLRAWPGFWANDPRSQQEGRFKEYRDKLRDLWSGSLREEQRRLSVVAYLLGLIDAEEVKSLWFSGPEAVFELMLRRPNEPSSASTAVFSQCAILPLWGSVEVRFLPRGDLEKALWVLFRESWRAKICGQCRSYFIADKPAQTYCSPACNGAAKKGQRLAWWNKAGKMKRAQRNARRQKAKGAR